MNRDADGAERMQGLGSPLNDLFKAVNFAIGALSCARSWQDRIEEVLQRLGQAVGASGAYVFAHCGDEEGRWVGALRYEWVAPGVSSGKGAPRWANTRLDAESLTDWIDLPDGSELHVEAGAQDLKSLVVVPVLVGGEVWGAVGFDRRDRQREWSVTELEALKAASAILAGALQCERMAQMARESEEKYKTLVENARDAICTFDDDGVCLFMNAIGVERLGGGPDDVIGKTMWDLFPKDVADRQMGYIHQAIRTGRGLALHTQTVVAGRERWYNTSVEPLGDATGEVTSALVIARDVTERHHAEQRLRASEESLQVLLDAIPESAFLMDSDGVVLHANEEVARRLGTTKAQLVGASIYGLIPAQVTESRKKELEDVFRTGRPRRFTDRRSGKDIENTISPVLGPSGETERLAILGVDVTERLRATEALRRARDELEQRVRQRTGELRKTNEELRQEIDDRRRAEQALRDSEERYRAVIEDQTELICRFLPDGTVTFVNGAYCRYFNKQREELIGRSFIPLIPEEDRQFVWKGIAALSAENPSQSHVHQVILPDGQIGWQHWTNRAILDEQGRVTGYQAVGRDITQRKRAEEELRVHRDHLEDLVQARTTELTEMNRHLQDQIAERKQAEQALRNALQKTEQLESIVNRSPAVAFRWRVAAGWPVEFVSENVSQFGYAADELMSGRISWPGIIHPDDLTRLKSETAEYLLNGVFESDQQYRLVAKSGEIRWVADSTRGIADSNGQVTHVEGVVWDVTQRVLAEGALRRSEAKYRSLVEQIPAITYTTALDEAGTTLYVSPQVESLLGFAVEEDRVPHETWHKAIPPEDRLRVQEEFYHACAAGRPFRSEYRMIAEDGRVVWFRDQASVVRDERGRALFLQGVMFDITQRKKAEEALREREERMRLALAGSNVGLWDWDLATGETMSFRHWAEILGYNPNTIKEDFFTWQQHLHPDDKARVMKALTEHLDGHSSLYEAEHRLRAESGQWRWMLGRGTVISRDKDGKPLRAVGLYMDIDDRKRAERDLQVARSTLMTAREEERRHFARELHDSVNQRIIALHLRLRHLCRTLPPGQEGALATAMDELCGHVLELVEEVRNISHGLYPPTLEQMGLDAALAQLSDDRADQGVPVTVRCHPDMECVRFRPEVEIAIFRIAQEALTNALRHAGASNVQISLGYRGDHIVLQVIDNGVGFDPSSVVRGLGLNAMQDRAGVIDGELEISSDPGCTCVEVRIPVPRPAR